MLCLPRHLPEADPALQDAPIPKPKRQKLAPSSLIHGTPAPLVVTRWRTKVVYRPRSVHTECRCGHKVRRYKRRAHRLKQQSAEKDAEIKKVQVR